VDLAQGAAVGVLRPYGRLDGCGWMKPVRSPACLPHFQKTKLEEVWPARVADLWFAADWGWEMGV
jgi:hypothetical protein